MYFKNRNEAALLLLEKLEKYRNNNPLILAIPRGAVPMAAIIANGLKGELGIILVHKIPAPFNEELAVAAIGLSGHIQLLPLIQSLHLSEEYLEKEAHKQLTLLKLRQQKYGFQQPQLQNRTVIIVDDGIATGATTLSAINEVKVFQPQKIILAAAVASIDAAQKLSAEVDELVILDSPENFYAVGQFFEDFSQVSDEEVIDILNHFKNNHSLSE